MYQFAPCRLIRELSRHRESAGSSGISRTTGLIDAPGTNRVMCVAQVWCRGSLCIASTAVQSHVEKNFSGKVPFFGSKLLLQFLHHRRRTVLLNFSPQRYISAFVMAETLNLDSELREEEFLCLESLLSPEEFQKIDHRSGIIDVYCLFEHGVELVVIESVEELEKLKIWVEAAGEADEKKARILEEGFQGNHVRVTHLPPITIKFSLTDGYPSHEPAHITLTSCWIPRRVLHQLELLSKSIWKQNGQQAVLYELFQLVTDRAAAGSFFPFTVPCLPLFSQEAVSTTSTSAVLESSNLLVVAHARKLFHSCVQFDENRTVVLFQQTTHRCGVCFESYSGANFIRLTNCRHFVCKECMGNLCANLIKDGSVHRLQCMECQEELNPFDIQLSVDPAVWEKYQQFQLDNALSAMQDIAYCPRPWCNQAVIKEDGDDTCGRCPGCAYVFCIHCKRGYHGIEPCPYDGDKKILAHEYEMADRSTKADMEKRFGRNRLRNLCDEVKAEDWVSKNAKQCPKCSFPVEKMGGCNKMVCTKCGSAFCWLCMLKLTGPNPYFHFQDPANPKCYMNLMQGIEDSDDENNANENGNDSDSGEENEEDWNDLDGWVDLGGVENGAMLLADLRQLLGAAAAEAMFQRI